MLKSGTRRGKVSRAFGDGMTEQNIQGDVVDRLHREAPLTDVHAHPSLKAYLFRRNLWKHFHSGSAFNPFSSRSDFKMLARGGVGVLWVAHILPERKLLRWPARGAPIEYRGLRVSSGDGLEPALSPASAGP